MEGKVMLGEVSNANIYASLHIYFLLSFMHHNLTWHCDKAGQCFLSLHLLGGKEAAYTGADQNEDAGAHDSDDGADGGRGGLVRHSFSNC